MNAPLTTKILILSLALFGLSAHAGSWWDRARGVFTKGKSQSTCGANLDSAAGVSPRIDHYRLLAESYDGTRFVLARISLDLESEEGPLRREKLGQFRDDLAKFGLTGDLPEFEFAIESRWQSFVVGVRSLDDRDALLALLETYGPRMRLVSTLFH